jgi:hypothetical protein
LVNNMRVIAWPTGLICEAPLRLLYTRALPALKRLDRTSL